MGEIVWLSGQEIKKAGNSGLFISLRQSSVIPDCLQDLQIRH
jgi:hypothetical protein